MDDEYDPLTGDPLPKSGKKPTDIASPPGEPLTAAELTAVDTMAAEDLRILIRKLYKAGWGYGKLSGRELLEMALKTKDDAYEALKLRAIVLATNATEWREFIALATFWAEREKGKPTQAVDVSGKIGIIEIVMESVKQVNNQHLVIENGTTNSNG